jgi:transcriptional regulator with XRE-family HTH domain
MRIETQSIAVVNIEKPHDHGGMNNMSTLGKFIRDRRVYRHQMSRDLAAAVGIDAATLSRLETGGMKTLPDPALLRRLAEALGVTVPDLLEAAGYLTESDRQQVNANPFDRHDIRFRVVEAMKAVDLDGPEMAFWHGHFSLQLRMYRDIATYGIGDDDDPEGLVELVLNNQGETLDDPSKRAG